MSNAAATVAEPVVEVIKLSRIAESPLNKRRLYDEEKLKELAESIRRQNLLQPVTVRPNGHDYELVFGHRRARAAKLAGLEAVPAIVRVMSDEEVVEAQCVENLQRHDVSALEEAESFDALLKMGRTREEIAKRIGKSVRHLQTRLQLLKLEPVAREALDQGKLDASTALLIARVPAALQQQATKRLLQPDFSGEKPSFRAALDIIHRDYILNLADAPFSAKDAKLVEAAGACTTCPKRTGNEPDLFGDVKGANVCTDPTCYRQKVEAAAAKRIEEAKAKGWPVLEGDEAKKALQYGSGYEDLARERYDYADGEQKKYRLLDLVPKDAPRALVQGADGELREVMPAAELKKALAKAGHKKEAQSIWVPEPGRSPDDKKKLREANRKREAELEVEDKAAQRVMAAIVERAAIKVPDAKWWRIVGEVLVRQAMDHSYGSPEGDDKISLTNADAERIPKMNEAQLRPLVIRAVLQLEDLAEVPTTDNAVLAQLAAWYGVDITKVEKDVRAELAAANGPKGKTTPAAPLDDGKRCGRYPAKKNGAACTKDEGHVEAGDPVHHNGSWVWNEPKKKAAKKKSKDARA